MDMNRTDVTDMLVGKMTEGGFQLHYADQQIGSVSYQTGEPQFHLSQGFVAEGERVYHIGTEDPTEVRSYVYKCDKGWC
jgi:hypothetical protein